VDAATQRVLALRGSMTAQLQEQLAAKLAACRPSADIEQPAADAQAPAQEEQAAAAPAQGAEPPRALSPQPAELQARLEAAAAKLPALRCGQARAARALQPPPWPTLQAPPLRVPPHMRPSACRACLEQASDRLHRVAAAVAADLHRPTPSTVERAVQGRTPGPERGCAGGDGQQQQQGTAGPASTRRRIARDVAPLPFPLPGAP
jgi:hypothetical protein